MHGFVLEGQLLLCTNFSDFASDSVTVIGLLGTSSGTQWVILLYWVPPDRSLLRFCGTESDAELLPYGEKGLGRTRMSLASKVRLRTGSFHYNVWEALPPFSIVKVRK